MAEAREINVKLTANVDEYVAGIRKAERVTRALNRMREGKLSRGWYWVFGLYGLSISLFILAAAIKTIAA